MKDESFEITEYLSKFKELPKLDPFKHESQMLSEENFSEIKERIQKAKGLIKDCQEYKEKIKSSFHELADLEANNCDEFINSNTIWTNLLEQLVATYEKNKLDAKLGYNLKQLSNLNEIKAPELVPKEGLVAALKKVEEFDKAIHQSFLIKPEYDSTKTPTFIKGNENYINIKALQRIEETPENTAFDGRFCIEDSNVWYYGGQDRKLKDGKLILASKSNRYSVAIYDPIQKCIVAKSENCNRDFLYIKEVSNGDIFTITEEYENKNILRIFRQKGAELTLVKQMLFKDVYNFQFKDSKDYMYAIKDNFYGEASGFIQLWSLDTQNDYKDMKMMAEYKTKNRTLYFLMCNDEKLIGIGRYNWYMLDPDTLKIIFEQIADKNIVSSAPRIPAGTFLQHFYV